MRTAKHFLRASAWLHVRERPDAFDFSAETFFLVFFSRLFVCFFHFCFVFSFLLQERRKRRRRYRRRKPIPSTLRRQEQHRYIILEHSSRVRINHHHQHERYLSVPSSKYYKKVCPFRKAEKLENPKTPYCKNSKIQTEWLLLHSNACAAHPRYASQTPPPFPFACCAR